MARNLLRRASGASFGQTPLPGPRQLVAEHIAEAMVSVDFARDLVSEIPADERKWFTAELQQLYDGMNTFLKKISN